MCILAFAIVINAPVLALPNGIDSSKTSFRKKTSSKLSICADVHNEEESMYVYFSEMHDLGVRVKLIPAPDTLNYWFVLMKWYLLVGQG